MKLLKQYDPGSYLQKETETLILRHEPSLHAVIEATGRIILPIPGGYQCCLPEEILYLKADSNYTEINYTDGSKKLLSKTLKVLEDILPSQQFFRIHKSYLVNAAHITDIILSTHESAVKLVGGFTIPVSRDKKGLLQSK
ncbi:MAG: LytTR family transcriptional regulator [Saprospiraceae bacterium]|nr:LytTR family transcriptional regulator [Saprospiraceae bacterium]MBP6566296.1 LytTR family transcriptional regulator [Saprospiraceae bacterium]